MFLEPMMLATMISGIHFLVHVRLAYNMGVIPFYLAGYTPS